MCVMVPPASHQISMTFDLDNYFRTLRYFQLWCQLGTAACSLYETRFIIGAFVIQLLHRLNTQLTTKYKQKPRQIIQVLQQEAHPAIWPLLTHKTRPFMGQNRRPVRDQAEPPCKISRRSVKPRLRNQ